MSDLPARVALVDYLADLLARHGHRLDARAAEALLRLTLEELQNVEQLVAATLAGLFGDPE